MLAQHVWYIHSSHPSLMSLGTLRASSLQETKPGDELTRQEPESMVASGYGVGGDSSPQLQVAGSDRGSEMGTRRGVKNFSCTCYLPAPFHNWQACICTRAKGAKAVSRTLPSHTQSGLDMRICPPQNTLPCKHV